MSAAPGRRRPGYDVGAGIVRAGDEARYLPTGETVRVLDVVHDGEVLIQFPGSDERCEWVKWRFVAPLEREEPLERGAHTGWPLASPSPT